MALFYPQSAARDWVGWAIGLMAIIAAWVFYRRSKIQARLVYQQRALRLLDAGSEGFPVPDEVEIFFKGAKVPRLVVTQIVIWNAGNATIRGEDLVQSDPLRFTFSGDSRVLRVRVLNVSRSVNDLKAETHPSESNVVTLRFDYLDENDGAVLEVLHTGEGRFSAARGSIKGVPKGVLDWGVIRVARRLRIPPLISIDYRVVAGVMTGIGLLPAFIGAFAPLGRAWFPEIATSIGAPLDSPTKWIFIGVGLFYAFSGAFLFWSGRRRFPKRLNTSHLE